MSERKLLKKSDAVIIIILLVCSFSFIIYSKESKKSVTAQIICAGKTVETIELDSVAESYDIPLCDGRVVVRAEKGVIYFKQSDCKDKLCVKSGKLENPGDTAACLPEKVVITLSGSKKGESPDIISY